MRARLGAFVHQSGGDATSELGEGDEGADMSWGYEGDSGRVCCGGAENLGGRA